MKKTTRLRELIRSDKCYIKPGVFDCASAKVAQLAGFQVIGISGGCFSVTQLGEPDMSFTSLPNVADAARRISAAIEIPLIVDADTGFGNAINVLYTTRELIRAGAAGMHIEDQVSPKRCGHISGKQCVSTAEMIGKIKAAVTVRDEMDPDFVIIARCDARNTAGGGMEELIDRCIAYQEAGADMLFPDALVSEEEIEQVSRCVKIPLHFNRAGSGVSPILPLKRLGELNVRLASDPSGLMRSALKGMYQHAMNLMERDDQYAIEFIRDIKKTPFASIPKFSGVEKYIELEKLYLSEEQMEKYKGSFGFKPDSMN